jgi:outer membrane protein OmpA-like peptidoglycan-associated protein
MAHLGHCSRRVIHHTVEPAQHMRSVHSFLLVVGALVACGGPQTDAQAPAPPGTAPSPPVVPVAAAPPLDAGADGAALSMDDLRVLYANMQLAVAYQDQKNEAQCAAPPPVQVTGGQLVVVNDKIGFAVASAEVLAASAPIVQAVADTLRANPDVTLLEVDGNADRRGDPTYNVGLTRARAESVVAALIHAGVAPERLSAVGLGPYCPIDPGDDDSAYATNRRVEFHIRKNGTQSLPWGGCDEAMKHGITQSGTAGVALAHAASPPTPPPRPACPALAAVKPGKKALASTPQSIGAVRDSGCSLTRQTGYATEQIEILENRICDAHTGDDMRKEAWLALAGALDDRAETEAAASDAAVADMQREIDVATWFAALLMGTPYENRAAWALAHAYATGGNYDDALATLQPHRNDYSTDDQPRYEWVRTVDLRYKTTHDPTDRDTIAAYATDGARRISPGGDCDGTTVSDARQVADFAEQAGLQAIADASYSFMLQRCNPRMFTAAVLRAFPARYQGGTPSIHGNQANGYHSSY